MRRMRGENTLSVSIWRPEKEMLTTGGWLKMFDFLWLQAGQCGNQIGAKFWEVSIITFTCATRVQSLSLLSSTHTSLIFSNPLGGVRWAWCRPHWHCKNFISRVPLLHFDSNSRWCWLNFLSSSFDFWCSTTVKVISSWSASTSTLMKPLVDDMYLVQCSLIWYVDWRTSPHYFQ